MSISIRLYQPSDAAVPRGGGMTAVDTMARFMLDKEMIVVGSTYWNMACGKYAQSWREHGVVNKKTL